MHKQLKLFLTARSVLVPATAMLGPIYAIFVEKIGGDILNAGIAFAIYSIISGIGIIVMGYIENTLHKDKKFIIFGNILMSIALLGYYFVNNIYQLYLVQIILGISTIVQTPANDAFYTKYLDRQKYNLEWGIWEGSGWVVTGIAALAGAYIVKISDFKSLFLVMFFVSLIGLFLSIKLKDKK
ncbi:MAG: MFS transporter [Nanoarchaeota archaeon]